MDPIRLLVSGDLTGRRKGSGRDFQDVPDIRRVGTARNGAEAVLLYQDLKPDVVGLQPNLPVLNGVHATELLTYLFPAAKVFMLAIDTTEEACQEYAEAGAIGFLYSLSTQEEFISFVREVAELEPPATDVPLRDGLRADADPGRVRSYLQAARWLGAFLGYGRTRLNHVSTAVEIIEKGHAGGKSWYQAAERILAKTIHEFEILKQELITGKPEGLWHRRIDPTPTSAQAPPRRAIDYYWHVLPAYRLFLRALERLHNCDLWMARARVGSLPVEPARRKIGQQLIAAHHELRWVSKRAWQTTSTLCMWIKKELEER